MGEYAGFNGGIIADNEFIPPAGDEGCPDQLGERIRDVRIQKFYHFIISGADELAGLCKVGYVVLWKVLQLDEPAQRPERLAP